MSKEESLEEAEKDALTILKPELGRHGKLAMDVLSLIGMALKRIPEKPFKEISLPQKVTVSLLIKLCNDLRSSYLLALTGYVVQAVTLVSSMFETAYCIAAIGSNHCLAKKWVEHNDPTRTFMNVKEMIHKGLKNLDHPDPIAQTEIEYRVYRQLCMAKHVNPLFQIYHHGFVFSHNEVIAINGPNISESSVKASWFALEHAAALSFIALSSFIDTYLYVENNDDLIEQVKLIGVRRKELEAEAKERWGSEDPFPGKW